MGVDPVTLSIGAAVIMGAASAKGAVDQNSAIKKAMGSTVGASEEALRQIQLKASISNQRFVNDARKARGSVRVAAAGAGISGADLAALTRQAAYDADLNKRIAAADSGGQINRVRSETAARLQGLENAGQNVGLQTLQGALQGAMLGYSAGSMFAGGGAAAAEPGLSIAAPNDLGFPTEFLA